MTTTNADGARNETAACTGEDVIDAFYSLSNTEQNHVLGRLGDIVPTVALSLALACRQNLVPPSSEWVERAGRDAGYRALLRYGAPAPPLHEILEIILASAAGADRNE